MTKLAPLPEAGATSVIFFGTPEVAVRHLESLVSFGCNVVLVVTRPDVRRGRGTEESPSPVKIAAQKLGIDVTHSLDDVLRVAKLDLKTIGVVVAYGEVLPSSVLEKVPMINVHFSLLPRWRGAAPVERAILAGDAKTGVCIMRVGEKLDEGEVYARREILINDIDTTISLREKLNDVSVDLVRDAVRNGCGTGVAQTGEILYAKKSDQLIYKLIGILRRHKFCVKCESVERLVSCLANDLKFCRPKSLILTQQPRDLVKSVSFQKLSV